MALSHVWLKGLDVVALARTIVEGLRDLTGETAALFKLQEDRGICILECESRHVLSISRGVGDSSSLTKGSTGKAMLGFMEPDRQSEILATISKGAQRAKLEEEIKLARQRGYATSSGEIFVGAVAVSAPYFDHRGNVVGSVGIYGPSARVDAPKMLEYSKLVSQGRATNFRGAWISGEQHDGHSTSQSLDDTYVHHVDMHFIFCGHRSLGLTRVNDTLAK